MDAIKKVQDELVGKDLFNKKYHELRVEMDKKIAEKVNIGYLKKV
jgi:hypothetical protein